MQDGRPPGLPVPQHQRHVQQLPLQHAQQFTIPNSMPPFPPLPQASYSTFPQPAPEGQFSLYKPYPNIQPSSQATASEPGPSNVPSPPSTKGRSGGKTFQCTGFEGCAMSFSRSEHLARHVRKHTGEKPFACRCGKKFTRLDNLRQHASTIHADEPEANEELFTRLAANMPRSGRGPRRKPAQAKRATTGQGNEEHTPTVAASTTFLPPQPASSPSRYTRADSFRPLSISAQESRLFPEAPQPLADPPLQVSMHSSHRLPQPLPSPSFRFPSTSGSHPISSYEISKQVSIAPHHNGQSDHTPTPLPLEESRPAHEQHHPAQYPSYPSHAQDYGRDGSSFRGTQSSAPSTSGVEQQSAGHSEYPGAYAASTFVAGGYSESAPVSRARSSFSTKPVLPSLSSLIAGAPLAGRQPGQRYDEQEQTYSGYASPALPQRLHSTLLVAAEIAIHDTHQDNRMSLAPSYDSRSSSFSTASANTSSRQTTATSPAVHSPCSTV